MDTNSTKDVRATGGAPFRNRALLSAGVLAIAGWLIAWTAIESNATQGPATAPNAVVSTVTGNTLAPNGDSYAPIVEKLQPAVVTIRSERMARVASQGMPDDPRLREFFGQFGRQFGQQFMVPEQMPEQRQSGLGSGVIMKTDGYILTNNHVVDGSDRVTVDLSDGRSLDAKVVGTDAPSDLAVLKIDAKDLPTLTLGNSDAVRVGDIVLAVGNPLGIGQTVTMGIVSAKGRATDGPGDGGYQDFIQTDAPINKGNSGGALVNTRGELIGINSQILSPSGGSIGIGFAIPSNMARNVMSQLIEDGTVHRGMLGVTIQPVTSDIARSLKLSTVGGALVNAVTPGGAADKAGVERGDVILAVNDASVKDGNMLRNAIAQLRPGTNVRLRIVRDGSERSIDVTLAELKVAASRNGEPVAGNDGSGHGMSVQPLTPNIARQMGIESRDGVVVTGVQPSGRAAEAGFRAGDVITEVDGNSVRTPDALRDALKSGDRPALLLVTRDGQSVYLTLDRSK